MRGKGWLFVLLTLFVANPLWAQYLTEREVKAPDFEGTTIDGRPYHLYESQAERIIVCFWSVNCEDCHDFLKQLRKHVDLKNDYELVSFALADDEKQVRKQVKKLRLPGWHLFDEKGWDGQSFLDYDVMITPTVILIDKEKNVVGEAYDWDEFNELIQLYEK